MTMPISSADIKESAREAGFDACGVARVAPAESEAPFLDRWLKEGCHAGMAYMERHREIRLDPAGLLEGAKTVISVALNYYPERKLPPEAPHIAYYAYGQDYHTVVKKRLHALWTALLRRLPAEEAATAAARLFTDSAPLLERYWAWRAGLGWIGKNTHLILPGKGSFFFLGEIVTTLEADRYDTPQKSRCGRCTRCMEACPTGALAAPHRLDARQCLSYLTIEHRGEIPAPAAACLDGRLYGCDTCQEACPWNRFARPTQVEAFRPSEELLSLSREEIDNMTEEDYRRLFAQSAVKRAKYAGLVRTRDAWTK